MYNRVVNVMGGEEGGGWHLQAPSSSAHYFQREDTFDSSINAISFGFLATALLISMFVIMAIFEKFLRTAASLPLPSAGHIEPRKYPSPKISANARDVSVLMPGNSVPTYVAHLVPVPCPPERMPWPSHG